jgi:hypothetical protein
VTTTFNLSHNSYTASESTYQRSNVSELLIGSDQDGLDEELVAALRIWRRVLLHGLEKNYAHVLVCCGYFRMPRMKDRTLDFNIFARLDAPTVWPHTVSTMLSLAGWHGAEVVGCGPYCLGAVYMIVTRLVHASNSNCTLGLHTVLTLNATGSE